MDYKYTGIILDKRNVGETDRIYSIYTLESGKIRVLAKSVRKANAKLAGFLENFTLAEIFTAKSQGMGKITGSLVISDFSSIRKDIDIIKDIFISVRLLDKLIKEENSDPEIFNLLRNYLEAMNELAIKKKKSGSEDAEEKNGIISLGFVFKLFNELGYKMEINSCTLCGEKIKEGDNFFDPESGGVVCKKCFPGSNSKIRMNSNSIKIIRIFFQNSIKSLVKIKADKKDIDNLKIVSQEFIKWTV
jgi:DNA repair protein RecO (recombination protein O)